MNAIIPSRRRTGFTLVEVLVVTGILAILFALATGVAIRALITAEEARVTAEMRQLESAITAFKSKYGVSYLPSRFRLRATLAAYTITDPYEKSCRDYLSTMFPRLPATAVIYWYPSSIGWNQSSVMELNGSECLVFFLGGWNGLDGFTKNPIDPATAPTNLSAPPRPNGTRGDVSFEFDTKRLRSSTTSPVNPFCRRTPGPNGTSVATSASSQAYVYMDGFAAGSGEDHPYYYFSSQKSGDDYDSMDAIIIPSSAYQPVAGTSLGSFQIGPHKDNTTVGRFFNPKGFQLFTAGRDKRHANIPLVPEPPKPYGGFTVYQNGQFITTVNYTESVDNLCNFHPAKMGIPQ